MSIKDYVPVSRRTSVKMREDITYIRKHYRALEKQHKSTEKKLYKANKAIATLQEENEILKKSIDISNSNREKLRGNNSRVHDHYEYRMELITPESLRAAYLCNWYQEKTGHHLNLKSPKTFNEKIQWIKLNEDLSIETELTDKYLVRNIIEEKLGHEYLVELIGVYEEPREIDFSALPERFVIKTNHGSGYNIVVHNKNDLDIPETINNLAYWLSQNYAYVNGFELQYEKIVPRILIEKYCDCKYEYQFWCFNGSPEFVSVISEPHGENRKVSYDMNWVRQPFITSMPKMEETVDKPLFFEKMKDAAQLLAKDFLFVRVDFLTDGDRCLFSELTFTPASGLCKWDPPEYDTIIGDLLVLPIHQ